MKIENSCLFLKLLCGGLDLVWFGFFVGVSFLLDLGFLNANQSSHKVIFVIFFLFLLSTSGAG